MNRIKKLKKLFSKQDLMLLEKTLVNKSNTRQLELQDYQNRIYLLKSEVNKKWQELCLYFQNEYKKIQIEHNQKMNEIDLQ
jgi:hypothetical protein